MILILSEAYDKSTNDVLQYILYYKKEYLRINDIDEVEEIEIILSDKDKTLLKINNTLIDFDEIRSFWYRRGNFNIANKVINIPNDLFKERYYYYYLEYIKKDKRLIEQLLHYRLKKVKHISSYYTNHLSKLIQLEVATEVGLTIPKTLLTNSANVLRNHLNIDGSLIKKVFHSSHFLDNKERISYSVDHVVPISEKDIISEQFMESKFQSYCDKLFEIRVFYLDDELYPMAIFSQENEKTKTDFRNYDHEKPNRNTPFKFPSEVESKIRLLMNKLDLNTGSLDFIYSIDREFVFLEVNPIGQFDWLSKNCNYHIPKKIAKFLCDENK